MRRVSRGLKAYRAIEIIVNREIRALETKASIARKYPQFAGAEAFNALRRQTELRDALTVLRAAARSAGASERAQGAPPAGRGR